MSFRYLVLRLLSVVPSLLGVTIITFIVLRLVPGDPIVLLLPPQATPEDAARLRAVHGLDRPIPIQLGVWFLQVVRGDFGTSIHFRRDVLSLILERLPATVELVATATLAAVALGVGLATWVVWRNRPGASALGQSLSVVGLSIPDFLWGLLLILAVGVSIPLLPISGRTDPRVIYAPLTGFVFLDGLLQWDARLFWGSVTHLLLPALSLTLPLAALVLRVTASSLKEVMRQDYILTARVKGLPETVVVGVQALRNALIPTAGLVGVQFGFLMGGTILVETIFSWPGTGFLVVEAIQTRDFPLLQGIVLTYAIIFIAVNLLVDVTYTFLNPRIRYE